ncbi:MAG: hypothetical protein AB3X44_00925 [Leptothrix sp. (in: b-proteobacteria)]
MDTKIFESQVKKTGFVLENEVAQSLKANGWTVISNKYYVDDFEDSVREIDLIAYQVKKVQPFDLYTVLVISCKKSESNVWGLLARDANIKDPNTDWWPLHAWSNDKAIDFQLREPGIAKNFHERAAVAGVKEVVAQPQVEVFAFQEMDKKSGAPQNDKPIFSAITSLMKAQAYELGALPLRKKAPSVYQFNLISVVDTELIRLMFKDGEISGSVVPSEHYLARYIIKKKETFSRIRFIQSKEFRGALADYERLHKASAAWFESQYSAFYRDIVKDYRRIKVLAEDFKKEITWHINLYTKHQLEIDVNVKSFWFNWTEKENILKIEIDASEDIVEFINNHATIRQRTKAALESIYKYHGPFSFAVNDIPF